MKQCWTFPPPPAHLECHVLFECPLTACCHISEVITLPYIKNTTFSKCNLRLGFRAELVKDLHVHFICPALYSNSDFLLTKTTSKGKIFTQKHRFWFIFVRSTQRCEWHTATQCAGSATFYPGVNFISSGRQTLISKGYRVGQGFGQA